MKQHYDPKSSSIVQSHKFNKRTREPGESIAEYVAALRQLAEHCDYGKSLNDMLRDKLVCGVNHDTIQQKLMAQNPAKLTFAKAMELAQRIEIAEKDARSVMTSKDSPLSKDSSNPNAQEDHKTRTFHRKSTKKESKKESHVRSMSISYHRCGGPHLAPACKFKEAMCYACKKRGHTARVCPSRSFSKGQNETKGHTT